MMDLENKRRATHKIEQATKRMRIETLSTSEISLAKTYEEEHTDDSNYNSEDDSEDTQSQLADTPLTPFSPHRKFASDLKTIKCTYSGCTKSFNRPSRLTSHLRSHTNERPFNCSYPGCEKSYIQEKHLNQHIKGSHTHEKPYQCDWDGCDKSFLTATRLRRHRQAHAGHERFRCTGYPLCNQTFRKHQTLQRHVRAEHFKLAPFPCAYVDPISKVACGFSFDTSGALRKHGDRVHGTLRYWCDECSTSESSNCDGALRQVGFRTKNELAKHIRTEHSNCIFCDAKYSSQVELQRHIETKHTNGIVLERSNDLTKPKTVSCTFIGCHKTFSKNSNLNVHIRTVHDGERFICAASCTISYSVKSPELAIWNGANACGKDFVSKLNLEDHIRTQHLGLPSIINAKRLKGHDSKKEKAKISPNEDDSLDAIKLLTGAGYEQDKSRNIPCVIADCPWLFIRQYDLELHLKSKHGLSSSKMEISTEGQLTAAALYDDPNDYSTLNDMYDQAGLEWDMQITAANENAPFWISAEDEVDPTATDPWSREEEEMRRLIDQDGMGQDGSFDLLVDPALLGI